MSSIEQKKEARLPKKNYPRAIERNVLIAISMFLVSLGIGVTVFFSQTSEKFFWEARTSSVGEVVRELNIHYLQKGDISSWQNSEENARIAIFAKELQEYIPSTSAIKIYSPTGILAWTNLHNVQPGSQKSEIDGELAQVKKNKRMILPAGEATKQELGKPNLLEVWSVIENTQAEQIGFVEIYFDTHDITNFITQLRYTFAGSILITLIIILFLLRLTFRRQNDIIVHQAHELNDIVEQSPIGIYTIDPLGMVTSINPKMLSLIEETNPRKIIGQNIFSIKAILRTSIEKDIQNALTGIPFEKEVSGTDGNGNEVHRHYRAVPLADDDKKNIEQILFMVEDITERKKLEKEAHLRTKDLEDRVSERTKTLEDKIAELEQFQRVTIGRELRMAELKEQIERMRVKLESLGVNIDMI